MVISDFQIQLFQIFPFNISDILQYIEENMGDFVLYKIDIIIRVDHSLGWVGFLANPSPDPIRLGLGKGRGLFGWEDRKSYEDRKDLYFSTICVWLRG